MPVSNSSRSAHDATNPRERIPEITATGVNTIYPSIKANQGLVTASKPQSHTPSTKLSSILPPLLFGTATFNHQFNKDPYALGPNEIVHAALKSGIRAFDTSPYYGPAESILGAALHSSLIHADQGLKHLRREDYYILTKCGRVAGHEFDYSPAWIRHSVNKSLGRLKTSYLDVVYLHDVEFVSSAQVLEGIQTLRQIRDEHETIRYVGICGYPVDKLCQLSEMILHETGEPLDIVQSYANFTIQNQRLLTGGLKRLADARVDVVPNASPLGMGLCRSQGVPLGNSEGSWHPAPDGLRSACLEAGKWLQEAHREKLETIAVRFAMERWLSAGEQVGSTGCTPHEAVSRLTARAQSIESSNTANREEQVPGTQECRPKLGVSVMGVSKISELEETMSVYSSILGANNEENRKRKDQVLQIVEHIREDILGSQWTDFAWESPDPGFVNERKVFGVSETEAAAGLHERGADLEHHTETSADVDRVTVKLEQQLGVTHGSLVAEKVKPAVEVLGLSEAAF